MKTLSLQASNFKSFDQSGIGYYPEDGLNLIVGENNTGKSNLLQLIQIYQDYLNGNFEFTTQTYNGNSSEIKIKLSLYLDEDDISFIIKNLKDSNIEFLKDFFTKNKVITLTINSFQKDIHVQIGDLKIERYPDASDNRNYYITRKNRIKSNFISFINFSNIIKEARSEEEINDLINKKDQTLTNNSLSPTEINVILMDYDFYRILKDLFTTKIITFPEFRYRPIDTLGKDLIATNGEKLSSFLYHLKNTGIKTSQIYKAIQNNFMELFPSFCFDVKKDALHLYFFYENDNYEIDYRSVDAGIIETLLLLSHLIYYKDALFILEEPELHLHPHAIRNMTRIITKSSNKNQIICSTHSPRMINTKEAKTITIIKKVPNNNTILHSIDIKKLSKYDIKYFYNLDYNENNKEIFFFRAILLVEGDTEAGAIPIFADRLGKNLDSIGILVLSVGGHNFVEYIKVLSLLQIPYYVLCDNDVIQNIEKNNYQGLLGENIKTSSLFLQLSQLKLLNEEDIDLLQNCTKLTYTNEEERCNKEKCLKKIIKRESYIDEAIQKLIPLSKKYGFFILSSDFETVIKKQDSQIYDEAMKIYPKSKKLQGIHVAQKIQDIPLEFKELIEFIYRKYHRSSQTTSVQSNLI